LGIQCVRRKEVASAITERMQGGINPYNVGVNEDEHSLIDVDLNIVRLCFEAFLINKQGSCSHKLRPVVSHPIYDKSK